MTPENRTPQDTTIKTPHAGGEGVPSDIREVPVREFDNTTLQEANERLDFSSSLHEVNTVQDLVGNEHVPTLPIRTAEVAEKPKKRKLGVIIGTAAAGAAIVGGSILGIKVAGDNSNNNAPAPVNPKATSEATPDTQESPAAPEETEQAPKTPEIGRAHV